MHAVDTNVVVRLVARDDAKQVASAEAFIADGAWVSVLAIAEATWVLSSLYERSAGQIVTSVEMLLNHQTLVVQDADVVARALAQFQSRPSIGFANYLLLQIATKAGHLPFGTFDRNLAKLEGAARI